ncbi:hypothetical protein [Catenuloplanes atrovinosus]|uniref:Uncharacterized protein n=1 Tax=Catenuloplanes atrovinosus TaxID=137266 RepID=A0AAE4C995_9ACTN|nr:hypothetical protein [Catenuloplanes atrovinosus]MDR7276326.1 hypothetical protein [Catenuloplanes atrovinosus]
MPGDLTDDQRRFPREAGLVHLFAEAAFAGELAVRTAIGLPATQGASFAG